MALGLQLLKDVKKPAAPKAQSENTQAFLRKPGAPPEVIQYPAPIGANRKILIVDDDAVVLKAFETKLRADGFEVSTTSEVEGVAGNLARCKAELIILDINFPPSGTMEWNGFSVIQWLRRFPELTGLPIILISGADTEQYREKAQAAGVVAFFQKPMDYQEILGAILKALQITPPTVEPVPPEASGQGVS